MIDNRNMNNEINGIIDINDINSMLMPEEKVLWQSKPDKKVYVLEAVVKMLPIVFIWIVFDSCIIGTMLATGALEMMPVFLKIFLVFFFIAHLAPVWIWIAGIIKRSAGHKNVEYVATNKRFIVKSGLINIDIRSIFFNEVSNINLHIGNIDRLFQVGDIKITGVATAVVMDDIKNPAESYKLLQNMVSELGKIDFPDIKQAYTNI